MCNLNTLVITTRHELGNVQQIESSRRLENFPQWTITRTNFSVSSTCCIKLRLTKAWKWLSFTFFFHFTDQSATARSHENTERTTVNCETAVDIEFTTVCFWYRGEILKWKAVKIQLLNLFDFDLHFQPLTPKPIDPFYSPILTKLDQVFVQLGYTDEPCRERLVCNMYRNPSKYSPHSNYVSAELSR